MNNKKSEIQKSRMSSLMCCSGMVAVLTVISGCSVLPQIRPIEVGGLFIRNNTSTPVNNVEVRVKKTGAKVSCSYIPAGKECSTTFPAKTYQGNPITVSWEQEGRVWSPREFLVQLPENLIADKSTMAVVNIGEHGSISARLDQ